MLSEGYIKVFPFYCQNQCCQEHFVRVPRFLFYFWLHWVFLVAALGILTAV